jgi:hypothetical protein
MDQSQQIDQDFFTQVEAVLIVGAGLMLLTLIIIGIVMAVEAVLALAAAVPSGGGTLVLGGAAEGITVAGAAGIFTQEVEGVFAAILACFAVWAIRHAILNSQYHVSFSFATSTTRPILNNPEPTKEQQDAINELLKELGSGVNAAWIRYLITLLVAAGMPLNQAMDIIRCLNARGWLQPTADTAAWDDDYKKAWNIVTEQLQPDDIQAAWNDMRDIQVKDPTGKIWPDHLKKVSDAVGSLERMIREKPLSRGFKAAMQKLIDWVNNRVFGADPPSTWPDKGRSNFWLDAAANSGCLQKVTGKTTWP